MTCDDVRTRLDEYVDGDLEEAAFQEVELHLSGCAACRQEERELRALLAEAAALGTPSATLLDAEREYARASAELMAAIDEQKEALSPETRALLDANLKTIDQALAQVRAALRNDPGNAQLSHLLTSTYQKKVDALQRVVRLNRL